MFPAPDPILFVMETSSAIKIKMTIIIIQGLSNICHCVIDLVVINLFCFSVHLCSNGGLFTVER